jgi:hypothetical protein
MNKATFLSNQLNQVQYGASAMKGFVDSAKVLDAGAISYFTSERYSKVITIELCTPSISLTYKGRFNDKLVELVAKIVKALDNVN